MFKNLFIKLVQSFSYLWKEGFRKRSEDDILKLLMYGHYIQLANILQNIRSLISNLSLTVRMLKPGGTDLLHQKADTWGPYFVSLTVFFHLLNIYLFAIPPILTLFFFIVFQK